MLINIISLLMTVVAGQDRQSWWLKIFVKLIVDMAMLILLIIPMTMVILTKAIIGMIFLISLIILVTSRECTQ